MRARGNKIAHYFHNLFFLFYTCSTILYISTVLNIYILNIFRYGYKIGSPIGFIRTTLNGCGKARLDFGNCANVGYTQVKLDGNEISVANANEHSKIVEFTFQHGSVLELSDLNYGIIKFNNFHVVDDNLIKCIQCHREAENGEMKKQSENSKTISNRHGQLYYPNPMNSLNLSYSTK